MAIFYSPVTGFFYDDRIPTPIPSGSIPVSLQKRDELLEVVNRGGRIEMLAGKPVAIEAASVDPRSVKIALQQNVDALAEAERLKYITPGNGQAMTYQQKVAEAQAFKAASNPQPSDYPILSSEVGITADTLDEVANIVLAAFAQWQQIGAMIESIRLGAKRDIDAAEDEAAARAIIDAIVWPSALVQS